MKLIEAKTVGDGGIASITFSAIPQTYTDLKILVSAKDNGSGDINNMNISFNGSASNLSYRSLFTFGSGTSSDNGANGFVGFTTQSGAGVTSNFNNMEINIINYTSAINKSMSTHGVTEKDGTSNVGLSFVATLWSDSAAITSVTLTPTTQSWVQNSTFYLYGISNTIASGVKAYGGYVTEDTNYFYHTFLGSGTFTPTQSLTADYLVVAGGGGGSNGGGGAGGLRSTVGTTGGGASLETALSLTAQAYTVTVGAGGAGQNAGSLAGTNGSNSVFSTITSTAGGGAGAQVNSSEQNGKNGGSGGGTGFGRPGPSGTVGTGASGQGYDGGQAYSDQATYTAGGGGGGAGAVGASVNSANGNGAAGGIGVSIPTFATPTLTGISSYYAGGGGGGSAQSQNKLQGAGGLGGGGAGSQYNTNSGTSNTGGGGGGRNDSVSNAGSGGSGIVIVRYAK
jgi:hypothetical protein